MIKDAPFGSVGGAPRKCLDRAQKEDVSLGRNRQTAELSFYFQTHLSNISAKVMSQAERNRGWTQRLYRSKDLHLETEGIETTLAGKSLPAMFRKTTESQETNMLSTEQLVSYERC